MIVKCRINKTDYMIDEKKIELFGLTFFQPGNESNIIRVIEDLYTSYENIKYLQDQINGNDLDEIHILDVCEDAISELCLMSA